MKSLKIDLHALVILYNLHALSLSQWYCYYTKKNRLMTRRDSKMNKVCLGKEETSMSTNMVGRENRAI